MNSLFFIVDFQSISFMFNKILQDIQFQFYQSFLQNGRKYEKIEFKNFSKKKRKKKSKLDILESYKAKKFFEC